MRKVLLALSLLFSVIGFTQTIVYPGNGKSGFGGAAGQGSISITELGDTVRFKLTRGPGLFDSLLVFYIDNPDVTSGISSTSTLSYTGVPSKYSNAASGRVSPIQQAILNFPAGFRPDLAVVFDKDGGRIYFLFEQFGTGLMQEQGTFPVFPQGNNASPEYTAITLKSQYGMAPGDTLNFNFMGTYIGQNASRSDEGFGDPFTNFITRVESYNSYTVQSWFNFSSSAALPVSLVELKAVQEQQRVLIKWSVAQEININEYEVQHSTNGRDFNTIATVEARNSSIATSYSARHDAPAKGNNYYRLRIIEKGGVQVSKVIVVKLGDDASIFSITQSGNGLHLHMKGVPKGEYKMLLLNSTGQTIKSETMSHDGTNILRQVQLNGAAIKGIYSVVLQSAENRFTKRIMLQ